MKISNRLIKSIIRESIKNVIQEDVYLRDIFAGGALTQNLAALPPHMKDKAGNPIRQHSYTATLNQLGSDDLYHFPSPKGTTLKVATGRNVSFKNMILGTSIKGKKARLLPAPSASEIFVNPNGNYYVRIKPEVWNKGKANYTDTSPASANALTGVTPSGMPPAYWKELLPEYDFTPDPSKYGKQKKVGGVGKKEVAYFARVTMKPAPADEATSTQSSFGFTGSKGSIAQSFVLKWFLDSLVAAGASNVRGNFYGPVIRLEKGSGGTLVPVRKADSYPMLIPPSQGAASGFEDVEIIFKSDVTVGSHGTIPAGYKIQIEVKNNTLGSVSGGQYFDLVAVCSPDYETVLTFGQGDEASLSFPHEEGKNRKSAVYAIPKYIDVTKSNASKVYSVDSSTANDPPGPDDNLDKTRAAADQVNAVLKSAGIISSASTPGIARQTVNITKIIQTARKAVAIKGGDLTQAEIDEILPAESMLHSSIDPFKLNATPSGLGKTGGAAMGGRIAARGHRSLIDDISFASGSTSIARANREEIAKALCAKGAKIYVCNSAKDNIELYQLSNDASNIKLAFDFIKVLQGAHDDENSAWALFATEFQSIVAIPPLQKFEGDVRTESPEDRKRQWVIDAITDDKYWPMCLNNYLTWLYRAAHEYDIDDKGKIVPNVPNPACSQPGEYQIDPSAQAMELNLFTCYKKYFDSSIAPPPPPPPAPPAPPAPPKPPSKPDTIKVGDIVKSSLGQGKVIRIDGDKVIHRGGFFGGEAEVNIKDVQKVMSESIQVKRSQIRNAIRSVLKEIKLLKEGTVIPRADNGLLNVDGKKYQLSKRWYGDLNLKSIDILPDGSAKVVITKGLATRKGIVNKKQVDKIVNKGKLGKEFTINTEEGKITAKPTS